VDGQVRRRLLQSCEKSITCQGRRQRVWRDEVDESQLEGARGRYFLSRKEHLQGAGFADQARQALRSSPAGDETEGGPAMAKERVRSSDAPAAGQCEIKPASHAIAVNGGNGRSREGCDSMHQTLAYVRKGEGFGAGQNGDFVEVGSGREEARIAGENEAGWRCELELFDGAGEGFDAGATEAVGAVGGDEPQDCGIAARLKFEEGHGGYGSRLAIAQLKAVPRRPEGVHGMTKK